MERQPTTREDYEKLRSEIRQLEEVDMPRVTAAMAEARSEGDLKENAEYHGQREEQGKLQAKINYLKSRLANCYIVDKSSLPKGVVTFGSRVTVKDLRDGSIEQYEFVGPGGEDYSSDVMKILTTSPLAQGFMNKKVGDVVEMTVPRGTLRYEVTAIDDE